MSSRDWTRIYSLQVDGDGELIDGAAAPASAAPVDAASESAAWARALSGSGGGGGGCSHDHSAELRVHALPRRSLLACCASYRRAGNALYSEGAYARALERYTRALTYAEYAVGGDDDDDGDGDDGDTAAAAAAAGGGGSERAPSGEARGVSLALHRLRLTALLNCASCHTRLLRADEAQSSLAQALAVADEAQAEAADAARSSAGAATAAMLAALADEWRFCARARVKALYRRAQVACALTSSYAEAAADCDAAAALAAQRGGVCEWAVRAEPSAGGASVRQQASEDAPSLLDDAAVAADRGHADAATDGDGSTHAQADALVEGDDGGEDGDGRVACASDAEEAAFYASAAAQLARLRASIAAARHRYAADEARVARAMFASADAAVPN